MHGWRARIGLVLPLDNAVMEPELYGLGLKGISFHSTRLDTTERSEMPIAGIRLAKGFLETAVDAVAYACAETSFLKGTEGNAWIATEIQKTTGLPATTAMTAMLEAVRALQASRIALVTPYTPAREQVMVDFWKRMDIQVQASISRDFNETAQDAREWYHTNLQQPTLAYQVARDAYRMAMERSGEVDAVVISATNFRTMEIIEQLERDLNKPVVTSNQAIVWHVLRLLGLKAEGAPLGRLGRV